MPGEKKEQYVECSTHTALDECSKPSRLSVMLRYITIVLLGVILATASTYLLRKLGY